MRITVEYLAYLLKERYLEQLLEAWEIKDQRERNIKLRKVLPPKAKFFLEENSSYPKIIIFDDSFVTKSIRFDFLSNTIRTYICLEYDRCVISRNSDMDTILSRKIKYSDLITSNESYDLLSAEENEIINISLSDLISFGLEV